MKCGYCKKEGVTIDHVRHCYGLRPRGTLDLDQLIKAANEARARDPARQQAERERKKHRERIRKQAEEREVERREGARRELDLRKSAELEAGRERARRIEASKCNSCESVPDINGRCNCRH